MLPQSRKIMKEKCKHLRKKGDNIRVTWKPIHKEEIGKYE